MASLKPLPATIVLSTGVCSMRGKVKDLTKSALLSGWDKTDSHSAGRGMSRLHSSDWLRTIHHHTKFGYEKVALFRRYYLDKARQTDIGKDVHKDTVIPVYLLSVFTWDITKPERCLTQSLTYFGNAMKQQKGMENAVEV